MAVDMAQHEITDANMLINSKLLDIKGYKKEGNKFLDENRGRLAWDTYEAKLAQERIVSRRLREKLLKKNGNDIDNLLEEATQVAYDEYNNNSHFRLDGGKKLSFL